MLTAPRLLGLLSLLVLLGYIFGLAPGIAPNPFGDIKGAGFGAGNAAGELSPFPQQGKTFIGVTTPRAGYDFADIDGFSKAIRQEPGAIMLWQSWGSGDFDRRPFDRIASRGSMPILSWEPGAPDDSGILSKKVVIQPKYRLSQISGGAFDEYIKDWAVNIKELGYPVAIRFAHEMNGDWYPWGEKVNGNKPGDYVKAWRHIHDLFTRAGAANVVWLWSPNIEFQSSNSLIGLYPGDGYVDWVGLVGYYSDQAPMPYMSFDAIFGSSRAELRQITAKPLVITETGATNAHGYRVEWIRDFFQALARSPDIIGFIWFQADKETDWRVLPDTPAATAFAIGVADPRYQERWKPNTIPLRTVETPRITTPTPSSPSPSVGAPR